MATESPLPHCLRGRHTATAGALLMVLFGILPVGTIADQPATADAVSRVADVALADLDLSTPEGMRVARNRLHTMAQRVCAELGSPGLSSPPPNFVTCVDTTLAGALKQINALKEVNGTSRHSVTRAVNISLAELDLPTLEGSRAAHERLEAMAQRLCAELARSHELSYQPNFAACVHDTLAGALAQANVLAAAKITRTARRSAP
jgi:UrcA family protein